MRRTWTELYAMSGLQDDTVLEIDHGLVFLIGDLVQHS